MEALLLGRADIKRLCVSDGRIGFVAILVNRFALFVRFSTERMLLTPNPQNTVVLWSGNVCQKFG